MDIPERIDVAAILRTTGQKSIKFGLILLIVVPAVLWGIGKLIARGEGSIPTFVWVIIWISALIGFATVWSEISDRRHPEKRTAFRWPEIGTPDKVRQAIEDEWNNTPVSQKQRFGRQYLTPSWLIDMDDMSFNARPLRYVAWAYYSSKSNYVNGVPTGTTRKIIINRINSKFPWSVSVASDEQGTEFLFALQKRAPWAFYGYSEAYYRGWKNDNESFIAAVKERYQQVQEGRNIPRPDPQFQPEQAPV